MEKNPSLEIYENLLRKNAGLLSVNCKIPVKDRNSLALVYTPGVGSVCRVIEKDAKRAYDLTNKRNAVLIVSDGSGLQNGNGKGNGKGKNSLLAYPYVEAICVYYKIVANIDAYPLIIDSEKITSEEDFQETVRAVMPAFSFVEFFGVSEGRVKNFCSKSNFSFVNGNIKQSIDNTKFINVNTLSSHLIYSGVIRASLDLQCYHSLDECVAYIVKYLENNVKNMKSCDVFSLLSEIVFQSAKFLIDKNKMTNIKACQIQSRTNKYIIEGKSAWIEQYPNNYLSNKHSINENSILLHRRYYGVVETGSKIDIKNISLLHEIISWVNLDHISSLIEKSPELIYSLTCKGNLGAIITNGTAILGFGDIGALAGLPVMEGKCVLFKIFGGTNVVPICIEEKNADKFISIVEKISPTFSAINLEDIKAPECFKIESKLIESISYPVFHDDQHGTAIVVLAGIINALKLTKKSIENVKIVMNGAGAAGLSVTELLCTHGAKNIIICDTTGAIYTERKENMNAFKEKLAKLTNVKRESGKLKDILKGADIFIGVSAPKTLTKEMIKSMGKDPIIFALANPEPEIMPSEAKEAGALIIATGRSDFDNQVNNSLAFPGIFRAAIDTRARKISIQMKIAASKAIANLITENHLTPDFIIPDSLDSRVPVVVANAVAKEALLSGLAGNKNYHQEHVEHNLLGWLLEEQLRNWDEIKKTNLEFVQNDFKPKF